MEKTINQVKAAVAAAFGLLTGLWGWICCMALDYLTGSMAAAKEGEWSSKQAREGIWHKAGMIVVVIVAAGADLLLAAVLAHLVENAVAMGAAVPRWLVKLLAMGKSAVDGAGEKLSGDGHG